MNSEDYINVKEIVDRALRSIEKKAQEYKRKFTILLLHPGYPCEEKERILSLQKKLKNERQWPNTHLMGDFKTRLLNDEKFRLLAGEKGLMPDFFAAIFTEKGSREGESWELGYLWSSALEKYLITGRKEFYDRFTHQTVAFIEKGIREKELLTGMLTRGAFQRVVVHSFESDDELLDLIDWTANRLLGSKLGLLDL